MIVKKFLWHVRRDSRRYYILCERCDYLRAAILPHALPYARSQVQTSMELDSTALTLAKLVDTEAKLTEQIERIKRHRAAAEALIARLRNDNQREALQLFFLDMVQDGSLRRPLTLDEACGMMGIAPNTFKTHRRNGIDALQKMVAGTFENAPMM